MIRHSAACCDPRSLLIERTRHAARCSSPPRIVTDSRCSRHAHCGRTCVNWTLLCAERRADRDRRAANSAWAVEASRGAKRRCPELYVRGVAALADRCTLAEGRRRGAARHHRAHRCPATRRGTSSTCSRAASATLISTGDAAKNSRRVARAARPTDTVRPVREPNRLSICATNLVRDRGARRHAARHPCQLRTTRSRMIQDRRPRCRSSSPTSAHETVRDECAEFGAFDRVRARQMTTCRAEGLRHQAGVGSRRTKPGKCRVSLCCRCGPQPSSSPSPRSWRRRNIPPSRSG